ncbi:MAG TPA: DUF5979 domain-containing protein [Cellulomonas sp.]
MSSPTDPGVPGSPSIAWSSFGHAETVSTPGAPTVLPAAEPAKVGVGLVFGGLQVTKAVQVGAGSTVPDGDFTLACTCTVTTDDGEQVVVRDGTATFAPDRPWVLTGVPAAADCVVHEVDTLGGSSSNPQADPVRLTVPWSADPAAAVAVATITNTFPATPVPPVDPGPLPQTGAEVTGALLAAIALLGTGFALVLRARSKPRRHRA